MADSFEHVKRRALEAGQSGARDASPLLRHVDPRQRKALELFRGSATIASRDVAKLFGLSERTARNLLAAWTTTGFLDIADPAKKSCKYRLSEIYRDLFGL